MEKRADKRGDLEKDESLEYFKDLYKRLEAEAENVRLKTKRARTTFLVGESKLEGAVAELAWLYLRKNAEYVQAYATLLSDLKKAKKRWRSDTTYTDSIYEVFCSYWCLSVPVAPYQEVLPKGVFFELPRSVIGITNNTQIAGTSTSIMQALANHWQSLLNRWYPNAEIRPMILLINPLQTKEGVLAGVREQWELNRKAIDAKIRLASGTESKVLGAHTPFDNQEPMMLLEYCFCSHYHLLQLSPREIDSLWKEVTGKNQRSTALRGNALYKKIRQYKSISREAPFKFFYPPHKPHK